MTDAGARLWHLDRLRDLRRLIDRARTPEALAKIEQAAGHEFDADLRRHLQQRMTALKAGVTR
jgi:phage gp46-like protein